MTDTLPAEVSWDWATRSDILDVKVCNCRGCRRDLVSADDEQLVWVHIRCHLTPLGFVAPEQLAGRDRFGRPYCWPCWNRRCSRIGRSICPVGVVGLVPWKIPLLSFAKVFRFGRSRNDGADGDPGWDDIIRVWEES